MAKNANGFECPDGATADVVIYKEGLILLVKRKRDPYKDYWAFPGGFAEPYEKMMACCVRETSEETGFNIARNIDPRPIWVMNEHHDPRGWIVSVTYRAVFEIGENIPVLRAGDDADECRWVPMVDIVEGNVPMAFKHLEIVKWNVGIIKGLPF